MQSQFQAEIGGRFAPLQEMQDPDNMFEKFNTIMVEAADKILGRKRHVKKAWIAEECLQQCDVRCSLRAGRYGSVVVREECRQANREAKRLIRREKEN